MFQPLGIEIQTCKAKGSQYAGPSENYRQYMQETCRDQKSFVRKEILFIMNVMLKMIYIVGFLRKSILIKTIQWICMALYLYFLKFLKMSSQEGEGIWLMKMIYYWHTRTIYLWYFWCLQEVVCSHYLSDV